MILTREKMWLVAVALLPACYLSHELPREVARDSSVAVDAFVDTAVPDAGVDAFVRPLPDASVTLPCDPAHVPPAPSGEVPPRCDLPGAGDFDGDGFDNRVDCNDCSPQINPGAFDFPGNGVDEDCSGADATSCDDADLPLAPDSAEQAARAIGLCTRTTSSGRGWGLLEARITTPDGLGAPADPVQVGLLDRLGPYRPTSGVKMLALATGVAREPRGRGDTFCRSYGVETGFPPGFPVDAPACPGVVSGPVFDAVALEVKLRVPTNVLALRFTSSFFTHEYPRFICSEYNDVFAVLQDRDGRLQNIVFDAMGNPITVNNALLSACLPGTYGGRRFDCPLRFRPLIGTGYDVRCDSVVPDPSPDGSGASTGCVETTSRVQAGEVITLRFAIWDSGDPALDSLVAIDGFEWVPAAFESIPPD